MPGIKTSEFAYLLQQAISDAGLPSQVFYDHGQPGKPQVGKIYGHIGPVANSGNILAEVDIFVVDEKKEIQMLIEIEEKAPLGPKKDLGVLMAILLSELFSFKGSQYSPTLQTIFICAGVAKSDSKNERKARTLILPWSKR